MNKIETQSINEEEKNMRKIATRSIRKEELDTLKVAIKLIKKEEQITLKKNLLESRNSIQKHTVKDLKKLAKNAGLRGYSRLKRADLIETLEDNLIISSNILENEPTRELRNPFRIQRETSALNRFTDQWKIEGRAGYSPQRFLNAVKRSVVGLLSNNRRIKVKMILMCLMEKENSQTGETVTREVTVSLWQRSRYYSSSH